jgi:uncharacterized surface protein with fasciclin (FAS1) repeats
MNTRMKTLGAAAAFAAIAMSIPTAVTAYADEPAPATPTTDYKVPDPVGRGCDAYKTANPSGAASFTAMSTVSASQALAANPDLRDFSAALSGQWNPEVNLTAVLDNGPYNVFAPTNAAFAKVDPTELAALKADPAALTRVLYYHMALGFLGPDTIKGKLTSQEGTQLTVTGKGEDIKVDDIAGVVCGGLTSKNARIYMIDTVLDPADAAPVIAPTTAGSPAGTVAGGAEAAAAGVETEATAGAEAATTPAPAAPATTAAAPAA